MDTAVDIKDALNGMKPVEEVPAATTPPLLPPPPPPVATNPGQTFTQIRAVDGGKGGCVCLLLCVCVFVVLSCLGRWWDALPYL